MKTSTMTLIAFFAAFLMLAGTQGCYTQLGTTRDEEVYDDDNDAVAENGEREADDDQAEDADEAYDDDANGYGEDWDTNVRFGFDYYYPYTYWPSVSFRTAWNDPYYGWGYDPWYSSYYSPWNYYRPWHPYYSYYGYGYGYYDPWYYGYPGYYYQNVAPVPRSDRQFGSKRRSVETRDVSGTGRMPAGISDPQHMDLPSGAGRVTTGGTSSGRKTNVQSTDPTGKRKTTRSDGTRRTRSTTGSKRGNSPDKDNDRIYRDRGSVSGSGKSGGRSSTPAVEPPKSGSSGGSSRGGGTGGRSTQGSTSTRGSGSSGRSAPPQSASPPPRSSSPAPAAPAPSHGGSSRRPKP